MRTCRFCVCKNVCRLYASKTNVGCFSITEMHRESTHGVSKQLLHERVAGHRSNAALVILVAAHFDVALLTPALAPAETIYQ